jgi:ABC-2 type transport system ATP-binding protein
MKIATGYLPSTNGTVKVCGFDVAQNSLDVRKRIGYLPEHNPLYLDMYVHEYLLFTGSAYGVSGKKLRDSVKNVVSITGLTSEQNKKIGALSKGYRQRVGLAQSLVHDPEVLILDEPTTGLDPNQIVEIRNLIKLVSKEKTVIFSTHIMQEVQYLCDRVIIIDKGKIVANQLLADLQTSQSENRIDVEFACPIDTSKLAVIEGVIKVESKNNIYQLFLVDSRDIRSEIFRLASDNNWPLVGLKQETSSLETIFRNLTQVDKK